MSWLKDSIEWLGDPVGKAIGTKTSLKNRSWNPYSQSWIQAYGYASNKLGSLFGKSVNSAASLNIGVGGSPYGATGSIVGRY